jgi:Golgi SNAP receptor complex protein 2
MRQQEAADREELLAQAELGRQIKNEMDEEAAVMGHINRSRRYLNDMFEQGSSILVNMAGNRERLKVGKDLGGGHLLQLCAGCGPAKQC